MARVETWIRSAYSICGVICELHGLLKGESFGSTLIISKIINILSKLKPKVFKSQPGKIYGRPSPLLLAPTTAYGGLLVGSSYMLSPSTASYCCQGKRAETCSDQSGAETLRVNNIRCGD